MDTTALPQIGDTKKGHVFTDNGWVPVMSKFRVALRNHLGVLPYAVALAAIMAVAQFTSPLLSMDGAPALFASVVLFPQAFVLGSLISSAVAAVYLTPSLIAGARQSPVTGGVMVINLFFGWTGIGWIVAAAMACGSSSPVPARSILAPRVQ